MMSNTPGNAGAARSNIACSSPARKARAGGVRAASRAGSQAPKTATAMPAAK